MTTPVQRSVLPADMQRAVDQTVREMLRIAHGKYGAKSAIVREQALRIIDEARLGDRDYYGMIVAIGTWVRDNVRYVLDTVGQETISQPEYLLQTLAGDCDDMTTLLIALLGSVGIEAWPVVVGMTPGIYEHVYVEAQVPQGASAYSGKVVAVDAIMKQWPVGKSVPQSEVKIRKSYAQEAKMAGYAPLRGLGAYATGPDYLANSGVDDIAHALTAAATPAGSMATVPYVTEVDAPTEAFDQMILASPTQTPGPAIGPAYQAEASGTNILLPSPTDAVAQGMEGLVRRTRPQRKHVIVDGRHPMEGGPRVSAPTPHEVQGLASLLGMLEAAVPRCGCSGWSGVQGRQDPLTLAGGCVALAGAYQRRGLAHARALAGNDLQILAGLRARAEALAGKAAGMDSARRSYLAQTRLAGVDLERTGELNRLFLALPSPSAQPLQATKARAIAIADRTQKIPAPQAPRIPGPQVTVIPAGAEVLVRKMG